jgi:hypothetical protein
MVIRKMTTDIAQFYTDALKCPFVQKVCDKCPFFQQQLKQCPFLFSKASQTEDSTYGKSASTARHCDDTCSDDGCCKRSSDAHDTHQVDEADEAHDDQDLPPLTKSVLTSGLLTPNISHFYEKKRQSQ